MKGVHVSIKPSTFSGIWTRSYQLNNRKADDGERFLRAMGQVEGKPLIYKALIGVGGMF
jgi:hypothetical protein